jgi:hypothetical protein
MVVSLSLFAEDHCKIDCLTYPLPRLHDHGYIVKASGYAKPLERHGETPRITTLYLPA